MLNNHPIDFNGMAPLPYIPSSGDTTPTRITGQCVSPPPIVVPNTGSWGQTSPEFTKDEMQKQWKSSKARLDMETIHFSVIAQLVELELRVRSETSLGQAAFLPPVPIVKEVLASPMPYRQWILPFTYAATFYDLGFIPENPELFDDTIQRKIWSLAEEFGISKDAPLTIPIQSLLAEQLRYAISLMDIRPYCLCSQYVHILGSHGEVLENWETQLTTASTAAPTYVCLPLRAICDSLGNQYPMHLPLDNYHLLGLDRVCLKGKHKYVITPSYTDWLENSYNNFGGVVVTWLGGEETIDRVDWSPISGRSVIYVVNPFTFGGNCEACLRCMRKVNKIMEDKGGKMECYLTDEIYTLFQMKTQEKQQCRFTTQTI